MGCLRCGTPLGSMVLEEEAGAIVRLWLPGKLPAEPVWADTPVLRQATQALKDYFAGQPVPEGLPLAPRGTDFQQAVWAALRAIPWGETRSYGQLARQLGRASTAARAVGQACHCNPIPILIPCHRVVGAKGQLTGFAGGLGMKETLLKMEQNISGKNFAKVLDK